MVHQETRPAKPRQWRKVHLGIDADTLGIRAIKVTGSRDGDGDAPMLPELLGQIPADQPIYKVGADGAHDTRACHAAIAARNACAVIPSRKSHNRGWETHQARRPGTKLSARPAVSAAQSGGVGVGIIDEVWSKQALSWFEGKPLPGNAWRATSTYGWPSYRSGQQS